MDFLERIHRLPALIWVGFCFYSVFNLYHGLKALTSLGFQDWQAIPASIAWELLILFLCHQATEYKYKGKTLWAVAMASLALAGAMGAMLTAHANLSTAPRALEESQANIKAEIQEMERSLGQHRAVLEQAFIAPQPCLPVTRSNGRGGTLQSVVCPDNRVIKAQNDDLSKAKELARKTIPALEERLITQKKAKHELDKQHADLLYLPLIFAMIFQLGEYIISFFVFRRNSFRPKEGILEAHKSMDDYFEDAKSFSHLSAWQDMYHVLGHLKDQTDVILDHHYHTPQIDRLFNSLVEETKELMQPLLLTYDNISRR